MWLSFLLLFDDLFFRSALILSERHSGLSQDGASLKKIFFVFFIFNSIGYSQANVQAFSYQGKLIIGHEESSFTPCNENSLWIAPSIQLNAAYSKIVDKPYEAVFARFNGKIEAPLPDGFASDYDGLFVYEDSFYLEEYVSQCEP